MADVIVIMHPKWERAYELYFVELLRDEKVTATELNEFFQRVKIAVETGDMSLAPPGTGFVRTDRGIDVYTCRLFVRRARFDVYRRETNDRIVITFREMESA